jgi:hypothetical protein
VDDGLALSHLYVLLFRKGLASQLIYQPFESRQTRLAFSLNLCYFPERQQSIFSVLSKATQDAEHPTALELIDCLIAYIMPLLSPSLQLIILVFPSFLTHLFQLFSYLTSSDIKYNIFFRYTTFSTF